MGMAEVSAAVAVMGAGAGVGHASYLMTRNAMGAMCIIDAMIGVRCSGPAPV